jgi:hypothetical protein
MKAENASLLGLPIARAAKAIGCEPCAQASGLGVAFFFSTGVSSDASRHGIDHDISPGQERIQDPISRRRNIGTCRLHTIEQLFSWLPIFFHLHGSQAVLSLLTAKGMSSPTPPRGRDKQKSNYATSCSGLLITFTQYFHLLAPLGGATRVPAGQRGRHPAGDQVVAMRATMNFLVLTSPVLGADSESHPDPSAVESPRAWILRN